MRIRTVLLVGSAAAILTATSVGAQQTVPPENAMVPDMPKQTTRTGNT